MWGSPDGSVVKTLLANAGDMGPIPGQEDPPEKEWKPTPEFLPRKSHGQRSLAGYSPWGRKRIRHNSETNTTHSVYLSQTSNMLS